jgi:hypothetical protein
MHTCAAIHRSLHSFRRILLIQLATACRNPEVRPLESLAPSDIGLSYFAEYPSTMTMIKSPIAPAIAPDFKCPCNDPSAIPTALANTATLIPTTHVIN